MLLAFKVGEIDGLQMGSGIVYVGSPFCPDGLHSTSCCSLLFGGAKMGSEVIFVDSPFCPDGLQRCVEFLFEERLVLVAPMKFLLTSIELNWTLFVLAGSLFLPGNVWLVLLV